MELLYLSLPEKIIETNITSISLVIEQRGFLFYLDENGYRTFLKED